MCGRFTLISSMLQLNEHFKLISKYGGVLVPRYNIAPGKSIPIIINRSIEFVNWGVQLSNIPSSLIVNAKFETALEKKLFKFAFKKTRCLIPSNGFFEWKIFGKQKIPYYIQIRNQPIFGMAGLLIGDSCVILTTATLKDKYKDGFHERLPSIIKPEHYLAWLDSKSSLEVVNSYDLQVDQSDFFHFPVSSQVNNVKFDNSMCIKSLII